MTESTYTNAPYTAARAAVATAKGARYAGSCRYIGDSRDDHPIGGDGIHPNDVGTAAITDAFP